ncbi:MAG: OmpA family protein [Gemmatimonadales bacterium]
MFARVFMVGIAVLLGAAPATAQQRGTAEFGAFASNTSFGSSLQMNSGFGGGGRIGVFLAPRWAIEFEVGGATASRPLGLQDVNVGVLSGRLTVTPLRFGRISVLLGVGGDHTDTHFIESFGYHGLLGLKFALSDVLAIRLDGIESHMANGGANNGSLHLGLSLYRNPMNHVTTIIQTQAAAPYQQRPDSVSAEETARLRAIAVNYQALRDSLGRPVAVAYVPASSAAALATMKEMIHFRSDRSDLDEESKATLRAKLPIFRENPAMRIVISGFASTPGTEKYNLALGLRRAQAAKDYLVAQGVDPVRIEIATKGEGQLLIQGDTDADNAANQRGQFRLLIADPYLVAPVK